MSSAILRKPAALDFALLLLLGSLWSLTYVGVKWATISFTPLSISAARGSIALCLLGGIALLLRNRLPRGWPA